MRPLLLASLFVLLCGAFAGSRVARLLPVAPRADEPSIEKAGDRYRMERKAGDEFEVVDGKWLRIPRLYADFDLQMDVELGEHVDLDVLVRQVEPRFVHGVKVPFHGRFAALRLTTQKDGPAWLSREDTLFGERGRGASLAPGMVATVWIEGRGRTLRANVAGKTLPPIEVADDHGSFTLVARGGKAAVHRLVITSLGRPRDWLLSDWFWILAGAAGGALVVAVGLARGERPFRLAILGVPLALIAPWFAHGVTIEPFWTPPSGALITLLGGSAVLVAALAWIRGVRNPVVMLGSLAVVVAAYWCVAGDAVVRMRPVPSARIDEVFGKAAGSDLTEAHAQLVRGQLGLSGPAAKEGLDERVMLLGGQLLYGRMRAPQDHLEPLLRGQLRSALQRPIQVLALPTEDGFAAQQWAMFARFYAEGHRPRAIVFGVPRGEERDADGALRSWPRTLDAALASARAWAKANGAAVVLFAEAGLPQPFLDVLRAAEQDGVPLVIASADEPSTEIGKRLVAALLPLLK